MRIYSVHVITDGKWSVRLNIRENDDFKHKCESRHDLRSLVDQHYNSSPEELAKIILDNVLTCEMVEVNLLCGPAICIQRT